VVVVVVVTLVVVAVVDVHCTVIFCWYLPASAVCFYAKWAHSVHTNFFQIIFAGGKTYSMLCGTV